jgi:diguanylate cyclase (GGDEF)-like protein
VPGRRERTALGRAIRGLTDAPDLDSATSLITEQAAWLLRAESACLVRADQAGPPASRTLAAPIEFGGRTWGAIVAAGLPARIPPHAQERLVPFADLLALAVATFEDRARLASLAGTDPLTGLGNRRTFDSLLAAEVEVAVRHSDPLSLVLLDIDHFKAVNDRFGHQLGDQVLIEVGRRLVAITRRGESVMRIGGEEFAWILPRTPGEGAEAAASRALEAISSEPYGAMGTLTVSAGVCDLTPATGAQEMVRLADLMLYRAKSEGRNTTRRFAADAELARTA